MGLWVIFALLTGAAVLAVLWPLSRPHAPLDAGELDVAFYKAQTAEIERDSTRGVIGTAEAEGARLEAARRLMAAAGGTVTAEAKASFEEALKLDPKTPRAAFYLGVAAEQDGDKPRAVALWTKLVADSAPNAPWLPTVRAHIAEATGESEPDVAGAPVAGASGVPGKMAEAVAALPPGQQQAMIHRMVDGLADRLKTNGHDVDGWLRLMRAYRVLDEQDKAKAALTDARRTFAGDPSATKRIEDAAHELGLEG